MTVKSQELFKRQSPTDLKAKWWDEDGNRVAQSIFNIVNQIEQWQLYRTTNNINYARLYSTEFGGELYGVSPQYQSASFTDYGTRFKFNIIRSCIDTACAKISKNKPLPRFLTSGGDWHQQKRAKQLNKYLEGLFYQADVYNIAQAVFRDACVYGTGALKVFSDDKQIKVERLRAGALIVDDMEGSDELPQVIYQRCYVARDKVLAKYPEHIAKIKDAPSAWMGTLSARSTADHICLIEAWHLKSGPKAKDGRHVIAIHDCVLETEEYKKPTFPIVVFRWAPRLYGFQGQGLASELMAIQMEITTLLHNIRLAQHYMAVPRIFIDTASQISKAQINNEIGSIIRHTGSPPIFTTAPAMSPEVYQHLDYLYQKAYELTGISQMSAQSQKPEGLDSAVALRQFEDIQTERFILQGQRWEQFILDIAHRAIDESRDLSKEVPTLSVRSPNGKYVEVLDWKKVQMDEDAYILKCFPVSSLPQTPAGRLATIQELLQAGFIDPQQGRQLLDFPDLEAYSTLDQSSLLLIQKQIDDMIEENVYKSPEPLTNFPLAKQLVSAAYCEAMYCDVGEDRLQLLRQYLNEVAQLEQLASKPPADPNAAPAPQAQAAPPPTSQLLPNAPTP